MVLSLEKFQDKFLNKMQKQYQDSYIKDGDITINKGVHELNIPLGALYGQYLNNKSINETFINCQNEICDLISENEQPVNYYSIHPLIKNKEFGKNDDFNFIRKHYFLDLDILIVEDKVEVFKFCGKHNNVDEEKAYNAAMFNINKVKNELILLHNQLSIYSAKFNSDYCASLILNVNFRKQIREKVGKNFLLALPSSSGIIIGCDCPEYVLIIKELMKSDDDKNTISSRVYRINGNTWEYAD